MRHPHDDLRSHPQCLHVFFYLYYFNVFLFSLPFGIFCLFSFLSFSSLFLFCLVRSPTPPPPPPLLPLLSVHSFFLLFLLPPPPPHPSVGKWHAVRAPAWTAIRHGVAALLGSNSPAPEVTLTCSRLLVQHLPHSPPSTSTRKLGKPPSNGSLAGEVHSRDRQNALYLQIKQKIHYIQHY